jgi:heme-degrading monooxygenase HmoA
MVVTIFRSRLRPEAADEYASWATRMSELAEAMPGYVSRKTFVAEDGERVTIVEFESEEHQHAWSVHPEHRRAKDKGRTTFYSEYDIKVCTVERAWSFPRPAR